MEGTGQQDAQLHVMDQQQPGWYGAPAMSYHQQLQPQQHPPQAFKWPGYDSSMQYMQPQVQPYGQPDFYMQHHHHQQQQHYPPPLPQQSVVQQPSQQESQHYMVGQQEQGWPTNNGWGQTQWNHQGTSTTGSDEEDWAAKARAWAAAKAAQEAAQQSQQHVQRHGQGQVQPVTTQQEQSYQDYAHQIPQAVQHPHEAAQLPSIQPPGQEVGQQVYSHDSAAAYRQDGHPYSQELPVAFLHSEVQPSYGQDGATPAYAQTAHVQVVSSSYSQDVSSYDQDSAIAAPPGTVPTDIPSQKAISGSLAPGVSQSQQPQSPGPSQSQSQQLPLDEPAPSPSTFEFHQTQQFGFQKPPPPPPPPSQDFQQQAYMPPVPTMAMDTPEINFAGTPNAVSVWPMGQIMVFPPNVGLIGPPGGHPGSQFDHPHHHHHPLPVHGLQQQPPLFPRQHGLPQGPGFRPPGPPGGGPFGFGGNPSLGRGGAMGPVFLQDGNGNLGPSDRPKKASVPSWLRDELLKQKSAVAVSSSAPVPVIEDLSRISGTDPVVSTANKSGSPGRTKSESSDMSENDEDDEDEKELARTAAMNQEIKRVLTEVLLKVTDDLFEEIAQEVLEEDGPEGEEHRSTAQKPGKIEKLGSPSPTPPQPSPPVASVLPASSRVHVAPVKESTSSDDDSSEAPAGNVLGLATYASDEEDGEKIARLDSTSVMESGSDSAEEKAEERIRDNKNSRRRADLKDGDEDRPEGLSNKVKGEERKSLGESVHDKDRRSIEKRRHNDTETDRSNETDNVVKVREKDAVTGQGVAPKGKNSATEDSNVSDNDARSPRRLHHSNIDRNVGEKDFSGKRKGGSDMSGRPTKAGLAHLDTLDTKDAIKRSAGTRPEEKGAAEDTSMPVDPAGPKLALPASVREAKEAKHQKTGKDGTHARPRIESTETLVKKSRENDDGSKDPDLSRQVGARHGEKPNAGKNEEISDKDKSRDKERGKTADRAHEKEKIRQERGSERDKSRSDKGRDRGLSRDRDRRKTMKDHGGDRDRRKEQILHRRGKRRSTSSSSRDRSRSRSPSLSPSLSSDSDTRRKHRRPPMRRSRRRSVSLSPVRSRRRRLSRSRSRSPPSKYSHRRHSPSPSRETERRR